MNSFFQPDTHEGSHDAPARGRLHDPRLFLPFLCALAAAAAAYHLLVILGHGNPDAVSEGLVCYTGADWALACGRWAIRYMNLASANLIMPGIWIALYALCSALSAVLLAELWQIRSRAAVCLIATLLIVNPTVIEQSLLQYMFMAWGLSNLLCVAAVWLCFADGKPGPRLLLAPLGIAVAFGLYQACVGLLCVCFGMTLILRMLRGASVKELLPPVLRFVLAAVLGTLLYFIILRVETARRAVDSSYRVEEFSVSGIFSSLKDSIPASYRTYAAYFLDRRLHRAHFYLLLLALGLARFFIALIALLRARRWAEAVLSLLLLALIPPLSNFADIIFPYNEPVLIMQYQSMLLVPFLLAMPKSEILLLRQLRIRKLPLTRYCRSNNCHAFRLPRKGREKRHFNHLINAALQSSVYGHFIAALIRGKAPARWAEKGSLLLTALLLWTYIVSANATYRSYDLSYRHTEHAVSSALQAVYALPDYTPEDVIAFAGFPQDELLRSVMPSYRYAYGMYDNLVFWDSMMGLQICRRNYLLNYFGIDGGHIYGHLYNDAVASEEFREMPVWPENGSVRRMNRLIIVKFSDDPTIFG